MSADSGQPSAATATAGDEESGGGGGGEGEGAKWSCEYCTYKNYRSAMRCTMCTMRKPLISEDIFRLSPQTPANISTSDDILSYRQPTTAAHHHQHQQQSLAIARSNTPSPSQRRPSAGAHGPATLPLPLLPPPSPSIPATLPAPADRTASTSTASAPPNLSSSCSGNANWRCSACTHLNVIGTDAPSPLDTCSQCGSRDERTASEPAATAATAARRAEALHNDMNDQLKALSLLRPAPSICPTELPLSAATAAVAAVSPALPQPPPPTTAGSGGRRRSSVTGNSPLGSASNLSGSRTNLGATARISPGLLTSGGGGGGACKWTCSLCTYENYPKSQKCSMCGQPGESSACGTDAVDAAAEPSSLSPDRADSGDDSANCASNYIISNRPPQQQQQQRNQHNRYQLVASSGACSASGNNSPDNNASGGGGGGTANNCDNLQERRYWNMRRQADWQWLHACLGVVENNYAAVEAYLSCGGNPGRTLTATEVSLLNRNSAFDVGHTLIHLAIRFHRDEMLPMLLTQITGSGPGIKRVPSYVAPDLAADIRRHFAGSLRSRKAQAFPCQYVSEHATFALPAEIEELPNTIQEQLHDELLDRDAQAQLECSPPALNWSLEITVRLGSRLLVLWNRSAGDCLLDSAMQATWGVFDRDNVLRRALADSLHQCGHIFYARWKEYEMAQAALLHFSLEEAQWQEDWASLLQLARQPGASLEQLHIFALAHILRRPIVVYGVKYVKSFRGEDIGFARFEGLYLPLLWDQSFCSKSPIALGYTRGHFSALVPVEPYTRIDAACVDAEDVLFLPLMDCEHKPLPVHFLTHTEMGREESIMRQWLDVCVTEGGLLVAQQKLQKRPLLVAQMLEEWLNHYRRIAQVVSGPFGRRQPLNHTGYSSDGDTDEE